MKKLYVLIILSWIAFTKIQAQVNVQDSLNLVNLYNTTNGANWTNPWNLSQPVSTWAGITIENNRVTEISLSGRNLVGIIPTNINSFSGFNQLKTLDLSYNTFTGTTPPWISDCFNLEVLMLQGDNHQFTGNLPSFLMSLYSPNYKLRFAWIPRGQMVTPDQVWNSPYLECLMFGDYGDCSVEEFNSFFLSQALGYQRTLIVGNFNLTEIPSGFSNMTALKMLYIPCNSLTTLPTLPNNLEKLYCKGNNITCLPNIPNTNFTSSCTMTVCGSEPPAVLPEGTLLAQAANGEFPVFFIDYDNDGTKELVTQKNTPGTLSFYKNTTDGYSLVYTLAVPDYIYQSQYFNAYNNNAESYYADLDNDGNKDLLTYSANHFDCSNNSVRVYWGNNTSTPFNPNEFTELPSNSPFCVGAYAVDFNNDGLRDVYIRSASGANDMYQNLGGRNFTSVPTFNTGRDVAIQFGDYDEDGFQDLAYVKNGWADGQWGFRFNKGLGDGNFDSNTQVYYENEPPSETSFIQLQANPMTNSKIDIAFLSSNANKILTGEYQSDTNDFDILHQTLGIGLVETEILCALDYNEDGFEDILVRYKSATSPSLYTLLVYYNNGTGALGEGSIIDTLFQDSPYYFYGVDKVSNGAFHASAARWNSTETGWDSIFVFQLKKSDFLTIYADSLAGKKGTIISLPIRVDNFKNIVSAQGTISFDATVVECIGTETYNYPNVDASNFNIFSDKLVFAFYNATGVTLPDSAILFRAKFLLKGNLGAKANVLFSNTPTTLEFADETFMPINLTSRKGILQILNNSTISGRVMSTAQSPKGIQLTTISINPEPQSYLTDTSGTYTFDVTGGVEYTISPFKNNDSLVTNGITALDLALIKRHILGLQVLNSPYKMIAADVNKDAGITALDLSLITRVILQIDTIFPNNRLWSFMPTNQVLTTSNAFDFNTTRVVLATDSEHPNQDLYGVKLGDVNDTWNYLLKGNKTPNPVDFIVESVETLPDEMVKIKMRVNRFQKISAFQFTLEWNPNIVTWIDKQTFLNGFQFNQNKTSDGKLAVIWYDTNGKSNTLIDDSVILELTFKATGNMGDETDVLFTSSITPQYAYEETQDEMQVITKQGKIKIKDSETPKIQFKIYPNPNTGILFVDAAESETYQLVFYDLLGRQAHLIEDKGKQIFDLLHLSQGVYLVKVFSESYEGVQKLTIQR